MITWLIVLAILLTFQFVVLFLGAPYLPTRRKQREAALDLLNLKKGQTIIDLGSGDGAMLVTAAKAGLNVIGYEINPILVLISRIRTYKFKKQVKVVQGNFWNKQWPHADGVFVFLTDRYMERINHKMNDQFKKPVKLVTYAFPIPGKKAAATKGACILYKY
jgi:precorrin-6B methylase 2